MKHIISIFTILILTIGMVSCIKDLDTEPLDGGTTLTSEKAWQDVSIYESMLAKIYAGFSLTGNIGPSGMSDIVGIGDEGETSFIRSWWNLQELTSDEALCAWANDNIAELNFSTWTSSNRFVRFVWNRLYMTIAYANEYLRNTTEQKLTERGVSPELKQSIATYREEVKTLRAMNYYFLLDLYGNVPIIDEKHAMGINPEQKTRSEVYTWLENEITTINLDLLPEKSELHYGRINRFVVDMLLAKLYLNAEVYIGQSKYSEVITKLNDIIDNGGYSVNAIYKDMFGAENHLSGEMIFPVIFDGISSTCYGGTKYLTSAAYDNDMAQQFGTSEGWSGIRALESLVDKFTTGDSRALFWTAKRIKETYTWSDFNSGYSVVKYTNLKNDGTAGSHELFPDTDFPMFRYSDVLLMYAEAVLRGGAGGDFATAITYVNQIRAFRNVSPVTNASLTLDFLIDERSRELYWEGHRRSDLIRFGKFTQNYKWNWKNGVYIGTMNLSNNYILFPIPVTEIAANGKLTQNTGY